jgi:hypothetical protein
MSVHTQSSVPGVHSVPVLSAPLPGFEHARAPSPLNTIQIDKRNDDDGMRMAVVNCN